MPCGYLLGKGWSLGTRFTMSNCEVVTFPLVSSVRCGAWLYRLLIFALFLTLAEVMNCSAGMGEVHFPEISIKMLGVMSCSAGVGVECYLSRDVYYDAWSDHLLCFGVGLGASVQYLCQDINHDTWSDELLSWDVGEGGEVPLVRGPAWRLEWWVAQEGLGRRGTFAEMLIMEHWVAQLGLGERYLCWDVNHDAWSDELLSWGGGREKGERYFCRDINHVSWSNTFLSWGRGEVSLLRCRLWGKEQ